MISNTLLGIACGGCLALSTLGLASSDSTEYKRIDVQRDTNTWAYGVNITSANVDSLDNSVFAFGVFGDYFTSPNLSLGLSLDYWDDSFEASGGRRVEVNDLVLGGNGRFLFLTPTDGFRPYVLAGLAIHRFQVDVANRDPNADPMVDKFTEYDTNTQDVEGEFGVDLGTGVTYRVQPAMDLVGEVRYRRILDRTVDLDQVNYSLALSYVM